MKKQRPAYPEDKFLEEVIVLPNAIASTLIMERVHKINGVVALSDDQYNWFCNFADWWVRWFYANNKKWKSELKKEDPREWLYMWIGHWVDAFNQEPDDYITKMRMMNAESPDPEWKPGGMLV